MMTGALLVALSSFALEKACAFLFPTYPLSRIGRLYSTVSIDSSISRLSTFQTLLSKHGAPGSLGCKEADDLMPVQEQNLNLHPHLYAIAQSAKTGNYVCALRRCFAEDSDYASSSCAPWPIVESAAGARGMKLLSLNSEHMMRRIACESDFSGRLDLVSIYNDGLGQGRLDQGLDSPYEMGSVQKLGYGCDKYVLLRVGPFPDLYEVMAIRHKHRGDESSSLIAAEANNGKFVGFASTFALYAHLLHSFGAREDEARDAARMCLRLPLPSIGITDENWKEVAVLAQIANRDESMDEVLAKMQIFYEKMKAKEREEDLSGVSSGKSGEQVAIDSANDLLDRTALGSANWAEIRSELAKVYANAGKDEMAAFVIDPDRS